MYWFRDNTNEKKELCRFKIIWKRIEKFQELKEAVANYCLNASEKIRSESLVAKAITVLSELVLFKETMVIIQMQRQSIFQLQQTIVLKLLKLQFRF